MSTKQLTKSVQKHWKKGHVRDAFTTIANYVAEHPEQQALESMLTKIHSAMDAAQIKQGEKVEIHFKGRQESPKYHREGKCLFCPNHLRFKTKIAFSVDGKTLDFGRLGDLVGDECFSHFTYIVDAARRPGFKMYDMPDRKREKEYERLKKVSLTLEQLSPKAVKALAKEGFDLTAEIPASLADEIQKQIMRGDFSGVRRETDTGKNKDIVQWGIRNRNDGKIYDPAIIHTINLLEHRPDRVTREQWTAYMLYQWQEREFEAKSELGIVRDDILYLARLQKEQPDHKVVQEHSRVDLDKKLEPVRIYNKAKWEEVTLGEILDDKRASVTKAQSRAAKQAVPHLNERRAQHNSQIARAYCKETKELNTILAALETRYNAERQRYANEKHLNPKIEPDWPWKREAGSVLENFFIDNKQRIEQTDTNATAHDILLKYVKMQDAQHVVKTLYTEGRKLQLAQKLGDHVLAQSYTPLQDLGIQDLEVKLDKLLNGAIEFDCMEKDAKGKEYAQKCMPRHTRDKIQKARTTQKALQKLISEVRESITFGIVPAKYAQNDGNGSLLERALAITENYQRIEPETSQKLDYLNRLEDELGVKFVNLRADDGWTSRRKSDPKFKPKAYQGKAYLSPEQTKAINSAFGMLNHDLKDPEGKELDLKEAKASIDRVEQFYKDHNVYTAIEKWFLDKAEVQKDELPKDYGYAVRYKPVSAYKKLDKEIEAFKQGRESTYFKINSDTRRKILAVKHDSSLKLPADLDAMLEDTKTVLRKEAADQINKKYEDMIKRVIEKGYDKLQNSNMNYFDVVVERRTGSDPEDHNIRRAFGSKHNKPKGLLKWLEKGKVKKFNEYTLEGHPEWGTWYGRGRSRDYLGFLCSKADQQKGERVYISIIGARE
jgi:hypothetical protein